MTATATVEQRVEEHVGRIVVRHPSGLSGAPLEIERVGAVRGSRRPGPITALVFVIGLLLLVFAAYVHSGPAIGAVSFALFAMLWLVVGSGRRAAASSRVRVGEDRILAESDGASVEASLGDVQEIGIGLDGGSHHTVWARVEGRGRLLLLSGLTALEARTAREHVRRAVEHTP